MLCCGFKKRMGNTESTQNTERNDDDVRSTTHIHVLDEDFGQKESEVRMMTIQALKLVKLCRNEYESDEIFISDDNIKCPREFMESMKYVAKYIMNKRSNNAYDQTAYHQKDDTAKDPFKNKQPPSKRKKKKKGIAERFNMKRGSTSTDLRTWFEKEKESMENEDKNRIRPASSTPDDRTPSAITTEEFTIDNERKSSLRDNGSLIAGIFNTEESTPMKNNEHEETSVTRYSSEQDKPSPAVLFLASSLLSEQKEDYIIRQDQDQEHKTQVQAMTNKVQWLCTLCSQQHLEHTITDHSASTCPLEFLQYINLIEIHIDDFKRTIEDLRHEKNDYINRLSQVAGARLTDIYPNITELNDPIRPVKLGERLGKIYDDEWTDAMQELERKYLHSKKKEKKHEKIVYHLYSIIKVLYNTCKQKAEQQLGHFVLLNDMSQYQVESLWSDIEPEKRKSIVESRKKIAVANIKMLQNILKDDDIYKKEISSLSPPLDEKIFDYLRNSPYFEKCLEICWLFVIQDPPLYLDILPLEGKLLNEDTHKEYTKSGNIIKYTVWPALYLHCQNNTKGPLLAKGVVQPKERKYVREISEKDQLQIDQAN